MSEYKNIRIKKKFGQHFLRDKNITHAAISKVEIDKNSSILEIGCGDGFLTEDILSTKAARLWVFEIDPEWAHFVQEKFKHETRLTIFTENVLDVDFTRLKEHAPWTVVANLPYQITFPIFHMFQKNRALIKEGVVMIQEEVAQKIVKTYGRGYGYQSLFLQHYFDFELLSKVPPEAFYPPPKVDSRLIYFKPKKDIVPISDEPRFWKFIKCCLMQPRRTLINNLRQTHYDLSKISPETLPLRAQQMSMADFIKLWDLLH